MLAPLAAVLLFLAAIVAAFGYLRLEEVEREQEAVKRDLEYAQQRLRLRLLERQEQLMRLARDIELLLFPTRPVAAGVLATSGQHADHAAAATAHTPDGARALRRGDPG